MGNRIKERREALGQSVDWLAKRIGKDRSTIYRYESGDITKLTVESLLALANALETTPMDILGLARSAGFSDAILTWNGNRAAYFSSGGLSAKHLDTWVKELGHVEFTDEENRQIIEFAKYLLYRRGEGLHEDR